MRGRFKRIVLLSMIVLVVAVPSVSAAEVPVSDPSGGQDVRVQPEVSGVTIDLTLPDYKIEDVVRDGVTYQQIAVDSDGWAQAGLAGAPRLPERGLMVAVPPTGDVTLEIIDAAPLTASGSYRLDPAPFVNLEEDRLVETWQPSPDKYAEAAWTPAAQAEIAQEGWLRGYRFVRLSLRPFQYNPASGEIRVASTLRVRLAFSEPGPSVPSLPADPIYAPVFWSTFANYDQAMDWQTRPEPDAVEPRQMRHRSPGQGDGQRRRLIPGDVQRSAQCRRYSRYAGYAQSAYLPFAGRGCRATHLRRRRERRRVQSQ